jgi:hypothetical protein
MRQKIYYSIAVLDFFTLLHPVLEQLLDDQAARQQLQWNCSNRVHSMAEPFMTRCSKQLLQVQQHQEAAQQ